MKIEQIKNIILSISYKIIESEKYLNYLDSILGDGDHGSNLSGAFKTVIDDLEKNDYLYLEDLFRMISYTLLQKCGGISGGLYGVFFLYFAEELNEKTSMDKESLNKAFLSGFKSLKTRSQAQLGDKTLIDILEPVSHALNSNFSYEEVLFIAENSLNNSKNLISKRGKAALYKEKSKGFIDPGLASSYIMIKTLLGELNG